MKERTEDEVPYDEHVANARPVADRHDAGENDVNDDDNTTGPGGNGEFVGRVQGQDEGYAGETGAERRAAAQSKNDGGR